MKKLFLTLLCLSAAVTVFTQKKSKPNILFLFMDDHTFDGINRLGNTEIITPNMDRLVRSGVTFINTYNMGGWSGAISVASRSQLISGRMLWNAQKQDKEEKYKKLYAENELWPQQMKAEGYKTYMIGKWHVAHIQPKWVFDEVELIRHGMPKDTPEGYNRPLSPLDTVWNPWDKSKGGYWSEGTHWTEKQADAIIDFLKRNEKTDTPLFMYCAFNAPHDPRQSPKEYVDKYNPANIRIPQNFLTRHPLLNEMGCEEKLRDEKLAPFPRTHYSVQKNRQEYYAIITHLDYHLGRILDELKRTGMDKNTLIVLTADNGLSVGQHGLMGKQSMYEHSMKVPMILSGCGLPTNEIRHQMIYLQDIVPTLLQWINGKKTSPTQFTSFYESLFNSKSKNRKYIYGAYLNKQRMIKSDRYKLFFIPKAKVAYLFDLKNDPWEKNNLITNPKYKKIIQELAVQYTLLAAESGDTLNLKAIFPQLFISQ